MIKNNKIIVFILIFIAILLALTFVNIFHKRNRVYLDEEVYKNDIARIIKDNDSEEIAKIDYAKLSKDINDIDIILKEQVTSDVDLKKKSSYYAIASEIYDRKISELLRILNDKLDDEDFGRLQVELDDFQKNIDFATMDLSNQLESTVDSEYYINKYTYEEKQRKCHEILEAYKGFLK